MREELSFKNIIREPQNIHEDVDIDIMNANYHALESIIDKFYFSEYPKHPEYFSLLFSDPRFPASLSYNCELHHVTHIDEVIFTEYSEEDKNKLIELGVMKPRFANTHKIIVIHTFNQNTCFINLFVNE